ncbi:MAG: M48 family metalloprotease [Eubacteriaceae bacterium]|nr:M48 family metalloprotease [Eubacteriaceae bacterium]
MINLDKYVICFVWFFFYFFVFFLIFDSVFIVFVLFYLAILFSFTEKAEILWRFIIGVRPLRTLKEKERLEPIFEAVKKNSRYRSKTRWAKLFIQETMEINAFAFGWETVVLTRGSIELLNDECLSGLIAHELGHHANGDASLSLTEAVGNIVVSLFLMLLRFIASYIKPFNLIYKPIEFLNDLLKMAVRREAEYMADKYAFDSKYGEELKEALYQLYSFTIEKPGSIKEQIKRTHPPLTMRIAWLEAMKSSF